MNLRRLKHTLLRLNVQEKVIGLSSIAMIIGAFMPWYRVTMNFDEQNITHTALSGDLGVIGFVILLMSILSLLALVSDNLHLPFPRFGHKRENVLFFLLGQCAFLTLLMIAVYTKRSLDFTDAGLRFGSYMVLVGAFFGAFSAFSLTQKTHRHEPQDTIEEGENQEYEEREEDLNLDEIEPLTAEEAGLGEEIDEFFENQERAEEEKPKMAPPATQNSQANPHQANYFTREAGLNKESQEQEKKKNSMNFYEDN